MVPLVLLLIRVTMGLRPEHFAFGAVFIVLAWVGPRARRYTYLMLPFAAMALGYESLRLIMPYRGRIHVGDLYGAEQALFSVNTALAGNSSSRFFRPPPSGSRCPVWYRLHALRVRGSCDRLVSLLSGPGENGCRSLGLPGGERHWLGHLVAVPGRAALVRGSVRSGSGAPRRPFLCRGSASIRRPLRDSLLPDVLRRSANVFGAMPSLHAAYPTVVAMATWKLGKAWRIGTIPFAVLMGFSAIYLGHHYILDVLAGLVLRGRGLLRKRVRSGLAGGEESAARRGIGGSGSAIPGLTMPLRSGGRMGEDGLPTSCVDPELSTRCPARF